MFCTNKNPLHSRALIIGLYFTKVDNQTIIGMTWNTDPTNYYHMNGHLFEYGVKKQQHNINDDIKQYFDTDYEFSDVEEESTFYDDFWTKLKSLKFNVNQIVIVKSNGESTEFDDSTKFANLLYKAGWQSQELLEILSVWFSSFLH